MFRYTDESRRAARTRARVSWARRVDSRRRDAFETAAQRAYRESEARRERDRADRLAAEAADYLLNLRDGE